MAAPKNPRMSERREINLLSGHEPSPRQKGWSSKGFIAGPPFYIFRNAYSRKSFLRLKGSSNYCFGSLFSGYKIKGSNGKTIALWSLHIGSFWKTHFVNPPKVGGQSVK